MTKKKKPQRGGKRENAGRRSYFENAGGSKTKIAPPRLTSKAIEILNTNTERLNGAKPADASNIGQNVFIELLIRRYGSVVQFTDLARLADGEWRNASDTA